MPDDGAGIHLTALGAGESVEEGRVADFYTYPEDLQSCWVRGNMIASLDGGATVDGKAGGLAGRGDRAVFSLMRYAADVFLGGASAPQSGPLDPSALLSTRPEVPPLILTSARTVEDTRRRLAAVAEVIDAS